MRQINGIIIHCAATPPDWREDESTISKVEEVRRWHVDINGWSDIGYHFLIDRDGTVEEGRPVSRAGAHVRGHNSDTIGVCLFGGHGSAATDTFEQHFTPQQDAALRELIDALVGQYGDMEISGHNKYAAKACPGFQVGDWLGRGPLLHDDPAGQPQGLLAAFLAAVARIFGGAA
jgi:hypothetical protein